MAATTFKGTSKNGDFQEALKLAIDAAMAGLSASGINWTLVQISGMFGGIIPTNDLTVEIDAS